MSNIGKSIAKSSVLLAGMAIVLKIIGFIKQSVIAYTFGASLSTDVYFIAYDFISGISESISKALLISLVAVYTNIRIKKGQDVACGLINALLEILVPLSLLIIVIVCACAPLLSNIIAPAYNDYELSRLSFFIQILSPIFIFGCFEAIFGAIEDSFKEFLIPRIKSLIYSIFIIIACIFLSNTMGIYALVFAQISSGLFFVALLFISTKKYHNYFKINIKRVSELKKIFFVSIPLFIGNSVLQINQIVDKSISTKLGVGTVSALSYCHTLELFVTNIMIVNIGNIMFANFSELVAKNEHYEVKNILSKTIGIMIVLLGYVSVITIFCSEDIVSIVYYRGSFSYDTVKLTSLALKGYAPSFIFIAIRDLYIKSIYAFNDTYKPMLNSIISITVNILLSIVLSKYIGILGISIATSISTIVSVTLSAKILKYHLPDYQLRRDIMEVINIIPGIIVMIVCIIFIKQFNVSHLVSLILCTLFGFISYFLLLYIANDQVMKDIIDVLKSKMRLYKNENEH